ncbi:hypothetical protein [Streptomyces hygroscopicus]|nr:hypothetical protein [Streptomyces hygroscopicus]
MTSAGARWVGAGEVGEVGVVQVVLETHGQAGGQAGAVAGCQACAADDF